MEENKNNGTPQHESAKASDTFRELTLDELNEITGG